MDILTNTPKILTIILMISCNCTHCSPSMASSGCVFYSCQSLVPINNSPSSLAILQKQSYTEHLLLLMMLHGHSSFSQRWQFYQVHHPASAPQGAFTLTMTSSDSESINHDHASPQYSREVRIYSIKSITRMDFKQKQRMVSRCKSKDR